MRAKRLSTVLLAAAVVAGALYVVPLSAPSSAVGDTTGTGYFVTLAARSCPSYASVRANRARNNIQESLKDLGPDTNYVAGEAISVAKEDAAPQSACSPLTNWVFTTGTGIGSGVTGPWGSLSRVTGPGRTLGPTQASVPLLAPSGAPTGSTIAGATTVELTAAEFQQTSSRLWVQGGTPSDPVLDTTFPGQHGFAALRCAVDNLNGDNVEYIAYPKNAKHVLCYAYYVTPPPTSGTIIVRKQVTSSIPAFAPTDTFPFEGNISYTPDQRFTVDVVNGAPGQTTFFRAGGTTWSFAELATAGYDLTGISCPVTGSGGSTANIDLAGGSVAVDLAAGDTVTCTFTNDFPPPPTLRIIKQTIGGVGSFDISATGSLSTASGTATTTDPEVGTEIDLSAAGNGPYVIGESAAVGTTGRWVLAELECDGEAIALPPDPVLPVSGINVPGDPSECSLTNRLDPPGSITIRKRIIGATETVAFAISDVGSLAGYLQAAEVTTENTFYTALPFGPEDDTSNIALGDYVVQELSGSADLTDFDVITAVDCNGIPATPDPDGRVVVSLTVAAPDVTCDVTDTLVPIPPTTTTTTAPATTTTTGAVSPSTAGTGGDSGAAGAGASKDASLSMTGAALRALPIGLALLGAGTVLVVATRRRRRA